jgi:hypothetical protein
MPRKRAIAVGLAVIPLAAGLAIGLSGAAGAAPANCQTGALCGFTGANFTGSFGNLHGNNTNLIFSPWTSVDSVYNNGTLCSVKIFSQTNYTGTFVSIPIGYQYTDFASQAPVFYHHLYSNDWC